MKKSEDKLKEFSQPAQPSVSNESLMKERSSLQVIQLLLNYIELEGYNEIMQSELSNMNKRVSSQEEQLSAVNDQVIEYFH